MKESFVNFEEKRFNKNIDQCLNEISIKKEEYPSSLEPIDAFQD